MNWYKLAQSSTLLAQRIAGWLQRAGTGVVDINLVHQDIRQVMSGMDDAGLLAQGISDGEALYRSMMNKGEEELLPSQQQLLNDIRARVTSNQMPEQENDPSGVGFDFTMGEDNVQVP